MKKKTFADGSILFTLESEDRVGIVVGPNGTMIRGGAAISQFAVAGGEVTAVNGGFFGTHPYVVGKQGQPIGDVVDWNGTRYPDMRLAKHGPYGFKLVPITTPLGMIYGRLSTDPGGAARNQTDRTGAFVDDGGNLIALAIIRSVKIPAFGARMKQINPGDFRAVLLDGGGSTQVVTSSTHNSGRPVHNWIVVQGRVDPS